MVQASYGMVRVSAIVSLLAAAAMGQTLARVDERSEIQPPGCLFVPPTWYGSLLHGCDANESSTPVLWTMDHTGRKEESYFKIPDASHILIRGLSSAPDGTIAIAGGVADGNGVWEGFVARISPGHEATAITRTGPFKPDVVTIASDGVIWAIGWEMGENDRALYNILKRYSPGGKLLTSQAIGGKGSRNIPFDAASNSVLRASKDRVGWLTAGFEYREYSLDGKLMNRFSGPPWDEKSYLGDTTLVLGDDLSVFLAGQNKIWTLDRVQGVWAPISIEGKQPGRRILYGLDGDQLVTGETTENRGFVIVHWELTK